MHLRGNGAYESRSYKCLINLAPEVKAKFTSMGIRQLPQRYLLTYYVFYTYKL